MYKSSIGGIIVPSLSLSSRPLSDCDALLFATNQGLIGALIIVSYRINNYLIQAIDQLIWAAIWVLRALIS